MGSGSKKLIRLSDSGLSVGSWSAMSCFNRRLTPAAWMRRANERMFTTRLRCSIGSSCSAAPLPLAEVLMTSESVLLPRLHLSDSREIAFEDRVSKLFERIGSSSELGRL